MNHITKRDRRSPHAVRLGLTGAALMLALAIAACQTADDETTAVENTLDLTETPGAAEAVDPNAAGEPLPGAETTTADATASAQAFAANPPRIHLAPIVGAPVEQVTVLSQRFSVAAPQSNIRIQPSASAGIDHEIRGYFSALSENGQTTVIHVWDVFTPSGQRVHRIQGQERFAGVSGDPWASVPASVMRTIADRMLAEYAAWRGGSA